MHDFYFDTSRKLFLTAAGLAKNGFQPSIAFGEKPAWRLHLLDSSAADGAAAVSGVAAWRAAIDSDRQDSTAPMARTVSGITASPSGVYAGATAVTVPLDTATSRFREVCNGRRSTPCDFELAGLDAAGNVVFYLWFAVNCIYPVDAAADGAVTPLEVTTMTSAQVEAIASATAQQAAEDVCAAANIPTGGAAGQVVTKTADGVQWADPPAARGEANVIERITLNGTEAVVTGKTAALEIDVPARLSELEIDEPLLLPTNDGEQGDVLTRMGDGTVRWYAPLTEEDVSDIANAATAKLVILPEAPADGGYYARRNGDWVKLNVTVSGGEPVLLQELPEHTERRCWEHLHLPYPADAPAGLVPQWQCSADGAHWSGLYSADADPATARQKNADGSFTAWEGGDAWIPVWVMPMESVHVRCAWARPEGGGEYTRSDWAYRNTLGVELSPEGAQRPPCNIPEYLYCTIPDSTDHAELHFADVQGSYLGQPIYRSDDPAHGRAAYFNGEDVIAYDAATAPSFPLSPADGPFDGLVFIFNRRGLSTKCGLVWTGNRPVKMGWEL